MPGTIVKTITPASRFKEFLLANSRSIKISDELKKTAMGYDNNVLLEVTKLIGSLEISNVRPIDDELANAVLASK